MSEIEQTEAEKRSILRQYYLDNNFFLSKEGILKVLSILVCVAWCALRALSGHPAAALAVGAAGTVVAMLCALTALPLAARAPMTCFYLDVVCSTLVGSMLLVTALLSLALDDLQHPIDYVYVPLACVNAGLVIGSAAITYTAVVRKWDHARAASQQVITNTNEMEV